jgi:hypothetical protein
MEVDIADINTLQTSLVSVQSFGSIECIVFDGARVAPSPLLNFPVEEIELHLRVCLFSPSRCVSNL